MRESEGASETRERPHEEQGKTASQGEKTYHRSIFDFCMLTEPSDFNVSMMLVGVSRWTPDKDGEVPSAFAIPCPSKRAPPWLIKQGLNELQWIDAVQKGELKLRVENGAKRY